MSDLRGSWGGAIEREDRFDVAKIVEALLALPAARALPLWILQGSVRKAKR